jgi:hypothetical protein
MFSEREFHRIKASTSSVTAMKFKIVFTTVLLLTLVAWASSFWLASQPILNNHQADLLSKTTDVWQLGIGAIFGLLTEKLTT